MLLSFAFFGIFETHDVMGYFFTARRILFLGHIVRDVDWAGDLINRCATTSFFIFLRDSIISWKSKKQNVVARSGIEDEYNAMAASTSKLV